jgi:hypothetical protein
MNICPYCNIGEAKTDDHVFPQFLGGRKTIPACNDCNNTVFGGGVEGRASASLKQFMFLLRLCGMPPPKPQQWKNIPFGAKGNIHVDENLRATPAEPKIERDDTGRIKRAWGSLQHVEQIQHYLANDGIKSEPRYESVTFNPSELGLACPMDDDFRRLCIKMSIAAARGATLKACLDDAVRTYLLSGKVIGEQPVRIASVHYPALDAWRPAAGHLIYVHATPKDRRVYAIVQFFTAIQFHCELCSDYDGDEWAVIATHDPITHKERLERVAPLDCRRPDRHTGTLIGQQERAARMEQLRRELIGLYGEDAIATLGDLTASTPGVFYWTSPVGHGWSGSPFDFLFDGDTEQTAWKVAISLWPFWNPGPVAKTRSRITAAKFSQSG